MPHAIPPQIAAELRARLRTHLAAPDTEGDAAAAAAPTRALGDVCAYARSNGVQVEQLVVLLKETFDRMTPHSPIGAASAAERVSRLDRLVTLCIRTYFA
jgi:hypothetical protein